MPVKSGNASVTAILVEVYCLLIQKGLILCFNLAVCVTIKGNSGDFTAFCLTDRYIEYFYNQKPGLAMIACKQNNRTPFLLVESRR